MAEESEAETVILKSEEFADDGPSMFGNASFVDMLKQEQKELSENREVYIPIVGYEKTGLAIKYQLPPNGKELDNIGRAVMRMHKDQFTRNLFIAMDTMIYLCVGLYVKPPDMPELDEYVELDPEMQGEPVRFDARLAQILGMDLDNTTDRNVVKKLFGDNDLAIIAHAEKLNRWLMNTKADLSLELWQVGESQG